MLIYGKYWLRSWWTVDEAGYRCFMVGPGPKNTQQKLQKQLTVTTLRLRVGLHVNHQASLESEAQWSISEFQVLPERPGMIHWSPTFWRIHG